MAMVRTQVPLLLEGASTLSLAHVAGVPAALLGTHTGHGMPGPVQLQSPVEAAAAGTGVEEDKVQDAEGEVGGKPAARAPAAGAGRVQTSTAAEVVDLTCSDSDSELNAPAVLTRPLQHASPPRRSPVQRPRDGPASLSPPVSHAHPPLRPAASEFDTPVLKRERSPEPATTSKKAVRASSPSSVKVVPASPDASTSPGKRAQPAAQNSLLDTRIAALTACGALDDVVAGPCSGKDDTGSLNLTASESLPASSVPTSLGGGGADPTGSSNGPSEVKPATLLRPKPIRSLAQPTPPNQRLRLGALKCRIPPPPPPFPSSIAALTIPYLLSRSPRTVLVRPHSRFSRTSRAASPELGNPAAPSAASGSRPRARISLAASSEGYWRNLLPHLSDQPHVGDDMATHNEALNERVWKAGLEPESLRFRDVEPDLADRLFPPPVFVTGASAQMLRNATLPDPYDRREMDRQDALAAQQRDARQTHRAARRAARAVAGKRPPGDARASDDDGMAEARRRRKKLRPSLRHETEGQLQARLRQLERIDEEPDDESTDEDEDGAVPQPTVGFRALALQTQKALRAKRLMRRAMGLDPDSETDDEDGGTGSVDAMKE